MASNGSESQRPRIGLTTYLERARWGTGWDRPAALLPSAYLEVLAAAGAVPVLLPPVPHGADEALAGVDGLVLSGGGDIDPSRYGEAPHERAAGMSPERDAWEFALVQEALDRDLPVFGLCRGAQVLNVALGGTLHQHLPDVVGHERHRPAAQVFAPVRVRLAADSVLGTILGERLAVPCHHHQGIARVGGGLVAVGWAEDGCVEAVECESRGFVVGVQWHPEEDPDDLRLFAALVAAARAGTERLPETLR